MFARAKSREFNLIEEIEVRPMLAYSDGHDHMQRIFATVHHSAVDRYGFCRLPRLGCGRGNALGVFPRLVFTQIWVRTGLVLRIDPAKGNRIQGRLQLVGSNKATRDARGP